MERIHPGHEVLSLFGLRSNFLALDKKTDYFNLVVSLLGAFFIILLLLLSFYWTMQLISRISSTPISEEKVAWQPSQAVSQVLKSGGYLE